MNKEEKIKYITKSLTNIKPSNEQINLIESFRSKYKTLAIDIIEQSREQSREQSLALTKLEESMMWLVKSIVLHDISDKSKEE